MITQVGTTRPSTQSVSVVVVCQWCFLLFFPFLLLSTHTMKDRTNLNLAIKDSIIDAEKA